MRKKFTLPVWPILPFTLLWCEVLMHLWISDDFSFIRLLQVTFFALGCSNILGFLLSLIPKKAQKPTAIVLSLLLVVLYMTMYYVSDAYTVFMPVSNIFDGAGGVLTDFGGVIVALILRDWWRILLVLLPIILFTIFATPQRTNWTLRALFVTSGLLFYLLGFSVVITFTDDVATFRERYHFDSAVRTFGLNVAMPLNVANEKLFPQEDIFIIPETTEAPTETTVVTDPVETDPTETEPEDTIPVETEPQPIVYGQNVMNVDFAALAESETKSAIASLHKYVAAQTPTSKNEYTGLFKGKNLIFITAEAFSAEVIDPERTPTLYRLANEGIKFTDYYQPVWGGSTSTGEYTNLIGLVPAGSSKSILEANQQDLFLTIGNQLQDLNYFSAAYHNHSYTYYDRHKTHVDLGYSTFMGMGNGMEKGVKKQWPQSDLSMMEFTVDQYIDQQPFSIYYMTVSGHCNYNRGGNAMSNKNFDLMANVDASSTIKSYYAAQQEFEFAMAYLVQRLEEAGIADDTVIVIGSDHYPYGLEQGTTWGNNKDYLAELYGFRQTNEAQRDHNALIIWSGCLEDKDIVVDTPVYSLDILPTLSNLFGVTYDSRLLIGRDVFSEAEPLVLWNNYRWKTDKGSYMNGKFTPAEGVEVEEGYEKRISTIVKNKINYSFSVAKQNYFNYLTEYHQPLGVG